MFVFLNVFAIELDLKTKLFGVKFNQMKFYGKYCTGIDPRGNYSDQQSLGKGFGLAFEIPFD